ncbi:hypothetical protein Rvan_0335 [Rhodomicrobium vannielii ATCC 17100]|uniref:Uncharacterized protein n=1 Tax=Rhodomicrobium vannielii (strain ATCC 17100 / DSM 162 / LMG 4299 / NCIMB 10020 / ATH 3.1.1) TaxID=648757 RepID=E3I7K6_RHOVT|nr:hypothetical protein Rvan_0335 [Rhodomicrobium vannielii ATCC 17100]
MAATRVLPPLIRQYMPHKPTVQSAVIKTLIAAIKAAPQTALPVLGGVR